MTELTRILQEIADLSPYKAVFSVPYNKIGEYIKCSAKAIGEGRMQFESFTKTQAFHENVDASDVASKMEKLLTELFRQADIFTNDYVYRLKISSKGKLLHSRSKNSAPQSSTPSASHNREKKHIIDINNAPPVFFDIGIVDKSGKIINSKYDKYKQICRFVEFLDDVVRNDPRESYNIIDFGCGKSYLTFVCYHYMTAIMGKQVKIVGLDLKRKVIEDCNALCEKYGYEGLEFLCMDIKDYIPKDRPDMVIALHACDVATDYALYNAYRWQADYIFSVPCCQHELAKKISTESYSLLCDYGIIKERFSALATDALRGKMLEYCGYKVDLIEFIDIEHSPKNILIRATRTTKIQDKKRNLVRGKADTFANEFCAHLELERLVDSMRNEFEAEGKHFTLVVGKASMLLKDAMTVRSTVFGSEQGYKKGASRDNDDDTAWFANIYSDGRVISTSRMIYLENDKERLLGKIAVLPEYRKYGLGKRMLDALTEVAKSEKVTLLNIISQKQALGFYEKLGFEVGGECFTDEDIEMIPVFKRI